MSVQLGISISPSFVELCLLPSPSSSEQTQKITHFQRKYLGKETLTHAIQSFLIENQVSKLKRAVISSHHLEKILDSKLGSSVAQVVTAGFENWLVLRQPPLTNDFTLQPQRADPLASQDLIFGLSERLDSSGNIIEPLNLDELEFISSKLQMMNIHKVCIHLLFSNKNGEHQRQVKEHFLKKGFEVFSEEHSYSFDEMYSWRRNLLNASLFGAYQEIHNEIKTALSSCVKPEKIYFVYERGIVQNPSTDLICSLFFGLPYAYSKKLPKNTPLVHLGMERWVFFDFSKTLDHWNSPWGPIGVRAPYFQALSIQPSQEISINPLGGLTATPYEMGFEPGPILLGKAHRPLVFDILLMKNHPKNLEPFILRDTHTRLVSSLKALMNNVYDDSPLEDAVNDLKDQILHQILHQIEILSQQNKVLLSGPFASLFIEKLKKRESRLSWELVDHPDEMEAWILTQMKTT